MDHVDKKKFGTYGTATLYINDQQVAQQDIETQLGAFSVCGEGFMVGRCAGAPVTPDYPGVPSLGVRWRDNPEGRRRPLR